MNQNKKILIAFLCCIAPHIYGAAFTSPKLSTSDFVQKVAQLAIQMKNLRDTAEKLKTNESVTALARAELKKLQDQAEMRIKLDAACLEAQLKDFEKKQEKQKENFEAEQQARQVAFEAQQKQRQSEFDRTLDEEVRKSNVFSVEQTKKCGHFEDTLRETQKEQKEYKEQADLLEPACKTDYAELVAAILAADATVSESYNSQITYAEEHDREAIERFKQQKHKAPERQALKETSDALRALHKQSPDIFTDTDISGLPSPRGEDEEVQPTTALATIEPQQSWVSATTIAVWNGLSTFGRRPSSRLGSSLLEEK